MTEHKLRLSCLETYLVLSSESPNIEMEDAPIFARSEGDGEEEKTPKPKKEAAYKRKGGDRDSGSESDCELDNFQMQRAFKLKKGERAESLADSDVNSMDTSKTDPQMEGATESESEDSCKDAFKSVAQTHQQNKGELCWIHPSYHLSGNHVAEPLKGKKDKMAFRKNVEERRQLLPIKTKVINEIVADC